MQKVIVLNREKAVDLTRYDSSLNRVIISISSLYCEPPAFNTKNYSIKNIIYLYFDDVEEGQNAITDDDAEKIKDFANYWYNKIDQIVVHCDAGISRSAGVAAAILKHFTGDDSEIFNSYLYYPNMLCYRKVLNALEENNHV